MYEMDWSNARSTNHVHGWISSGAEDKTMAPTQLLLIHKNVIAWIRARANVAYPIFAGWSYDVSGSYLFSFSVITVLQILAIVFMIFATKPNPPINLN
jgi:hypothetical protein